MDTATEFLAGELGTLLVTPRPLAEYRDMFLLTDEELVGGPILDCPGGGSPFGTQVRTRGGTVVSVDPSYALPRAELAARIGSDLEHLRKWLDANPDVFDRSYVGPPDTLIRSWAVSSDLFLTDYDNNGERYVAAALPSLPFPDQHFSLTLSSHLLFTYPNFLTFEAHVDSVLELVRVTSGEVRLFPLVDTTSTVHPRLDEARAVLLERGVRTEIRKTNCAYIVRGDEMLVCRRADN